MASGTKGRTTLEVGADGVAIITIINPPVNSLSLDGNFFFYYILDLNIFLFFFPLYFWLAGLFDLFCVSFCIFIYPFGVIALICCFCLTGYYWCCCKLFQNIKRFILLEKIWVQCGAVLCLLLISLENSNNFGGGWNSPLWSLI